LAEEDPETGPVLRAANINLRLEYTDPAAIITVQMKPDGIKVVEGENSIPANVRMSMSADDGNMYWRGEYNVAVNLAKGRVKAKGPITSILKLIPATKPLFPKYKLLIAEKDRAMGGNQ